MGGRRCVWRWQLVRAAFFIKLVRNVLPWFIPNHMPNQVLPAACCLLPPAIVTTSTHPVPSTLSPGIVSRRQRLKIKRCRITKQAAAQLARIVARQGRGEAKKNSRKALAHVLDYDIPAMQLMPILFKDDHTKYD